MSSQLLPKETDLQSAAFADSLLAHMELPAGLEPATWRFESRPRLPTALREHRRPAHGSQMPLTGFTDQDLLRPIPKLGNAAKSLFDASAFHGCHIWPSAGYRTASPRPATPDFHGRERPGARHLRDLNPPPTMEWHGRACGEVNAGAIRLIRLAAPTTALYFMDASPRLGSL